MWNWIATLFALGVFAAGASAQQNDPAAACRALTNPQNALAFAQIPDAPTTILSAKVVPAGGDGSVIENDFPEICRVEGQIAPQVGFLLRMPTKTWNGKFMMGGCGGACGNYLTDRIDPALVRNYAVVVTDMGHKGNGFGFMRDNIQGQIDFGYRSTHVTAVAAKEIVAAYYGKRASHNYYWGCSTGGRQGMVEAQRFPLDFEGLIAGAPVWNQTQNNPMFGSWGGLVNTGKDGKPILDAKKLPMIHRAVMEACDAMDGLKDGILQDPRRCTWRPTAIQCKGKANDNCLTAAEVEVVEKILDGPKDKGGRPIFWGMMPGSEDQWTTWIGSDGKPGRAVAGGMTDTSIAFTLFSDQGKPFFVSRDFDYERDPPRLGLQEWIYNAQNPDLRKLKAAGHKLILYTGWHDNNMPPLEAVDYYDTATKTMGGEAATKEFFRFFLPPAVNHCRYGYGGGEIDWITALENWMEKGQAPDQVIAYHPVKEPYPTIPRPANDSAEALTRMGRHPMPPGSYDRSRPVFAYPDVAQYSGQGDPSLPSSWTKAPRP